jgi:hypothetical protein
MPKRKPRKNTGKGPGGQIGWGGMGVKPWGRANLVLGAIAAVALVAGGLYLWRGNQANSEFRTLAMQGQAALSQVRTTPAQGGGHLALGQSHDYNERFPTSGIHDSVPAGPGFYRRFLPPTTLVHSIEHGHVVIYYESPGAEAIQLMKDWTSLHDGSWDGVTAVPATGLGQAVVLTAWRKIFRLDEFDPAAAAAFIDRYRGRGPENQVR